MVSSSFQLCHILSFSCLEVMPQLLVLISPPLCLTDLRIAITKVIERLLIIVDHTLEIGVLSHHRVDLEARP